MATALVSSPVATGTVADFLGVAEGTVRRWCARGEIRAVKIGGRWFVSGTEWDRIRADLTASALR